MAVFHRINTKIRLYEFFKHRPLPVFFYIFAKSPIEYNIHMKKIHLLLVALLITFSLAAQKKEKIKGSKVISVTQREIDNFSEIEAEDNIEVFLVKGGAQGFEIEADDNLHDAVVAEVSGGKLRVYTSKNVARYKKFSVRITYTDELKTVTAKNEVVLNAIADLMLSDITIKNLDYSKSYLNVKSDNFRLEMTDKTEAELNFKGDSCHVQLSKYADLKALIATGKINFDMYEKATANIEGDAVNARLRFDNSTAFTGNRFTVKNMELVAEGYSNCDVMVNEAITITANGKAEIGLYGLPKIIMEKFENSAALYKKE